MSDLHVLEVLTVSEDVITSKDEKLLKYIHEVGEEILGDSDNMVRMNHFLEIDTVIEIQDYTYDLFRQIDSLGFSSVFVKIIKKAADLDIHYIVFRGVVVN